MGNAKHNIRKSILVSILTLTVLFGISSTYALDLSWIKLDINQLIDQTANATKETANATFSKSDYTRITLQIRDDWNKFASVMRSKKQSYIQLKSTDDIRGFKMTAYYDTLGYCNARKDLENALWKAYTKDQQSFFSSGYEQPWTTFISADCKTYSIKILKYVMGMK